MSWERIKETFLQRKWLIISITAIVLVVIFAIVALVLVLGRKQPEPEPEQQSYLPPVIQGVKAQMELYEDEDITAALLDGVTAQGNTDREGQSFPVSVTVYDADGNVVTDFVPGTYQVIYTCEDPDSDGAVPIKCVLVILAVDSEPPVITGAQDLTVTVGDTISYREGVTVTDNMDENVQLQIDASAVDLTQPGTYPVIYSAVDSWGNEAAVTITVIVEEAEEEEEPEIAYNGQAVTSEDVYALADQILDKLGTASMDKQDAARAIYNYVHRNITYVGTSDKSGWIAGAYNGFTRGSGDCYNYWACAKVLLNQAGISTVDLQRVGGTSRHYWLLINVGTGWYHFDATPHSTAYPLDSFMLTEEQVRAYTALRASEHPNYYVYDYASCPVTVVGTPVDSEEEPTPTEPTPTEPAPTEPATQPTEPATQPTEPATQPTEPATQPTEPATQPTEPATQPTEPATQPTEPATQPTEPATQPTEPATQLTEPATQPSAEPTTASTVPVASETEQTASE